MRRGALVEDLAEKRHRGEHVGLVDAGDAALAAARLAPLGEREREVEQALAVTGARDQHRVPRLAVVDHLAPAVRGEQPFGRLAQDHEIDVAAALVEQAATACSETPSPGARRRTGRTPAHAQMRRDFRAVGKRTSGKPMAPNRMASRRGLPRTPPPSNQDHSPCSRSPRSRAVPRPKSRSRRAGSPAFRRAPMPAGRFRSRCRHRETIRCEGWYWRAP